MKNKQITEQNFAQFLKLIRIKNKWTQKDLADFLGFSVRTIQQWEQGFNPAVAVIPLLNLVLNNK